MDSSLSTLDHDEPVIPPHHVIIHGHAYYMHLGDLHVAACDGPGGAVRWADLPGVPVSSTEHGYTGIVAALAATDPAPLPIAALGIGAVDTFDGVDWFYLISVAPEWPYPVDTLAVKAAFLPTVYREGSGPGQPYCHSCEVFPRPDKATDQWIGVAHCRRDV